MLAGAVVGVGLTLAVLTLARGSGQGLAVGGTRPACGVSIVLFEADDLESRIVDAATGGLGFSHVAIDGCEADEQGRPLLIGCRSRSSIDHVSLAQELSSGRHLEFFGFFGRFATEIFFRIVIDEEL